MRLSLILLSATVLMACPSDGFDRPVVLGGQTIEPELLNRGKTVYNRFCATCHGYDGSADTPQARQLDPKPANFAQAQFNHAKVPGSLPSDEELRGFITHGFPQTGMPPWPQIKGEELEGLIHYLKTFSPQWAENKDE